MKMNNQKLCFSFISEIVDSYVCWNIAEIVYAIAM